MSVNVAINAETMPFLLHIAFEEKAYIMVYLLITYIDHNGHRDGFMSVAVLFSACFAGLEGHKASQALLFRQTLNMPRKVHAIFTVQYRHRRNKKSSAESE